jgi:putative iron-regulated protein
MPIRSRRLLSAVAALSVLSLVGAACGDDDTSPKGAASSSSAAPDALMKEALATYAAGVEAAYVASRASAGPMDEAIDAFLAQPTQASLDAARQAWITARVDYTPTEAFRFYGGPIDNAETGKEGLINAWPLDEAYIDYVQGDPEAGIINHPADYPTIDEDVLVSLNEEGGEANISTGWHAIEFLLWGQDLSATGPGDRPVTDYTTNPNADRRARYLSVLSDLLLEHLDELVDAWAPDADNYRAEFLQLDPVEAMGLLIKGLGELSRGELANQRMSVAYYERSQENEHSCFSDNTTADLLGNAKGVQMVLEAAYPGGVTGTSVLDVVAAKDPAVAGRLRDDVAASVTAVAAIPAPFDSHLVEGVPDSDPGRASVLAGIQNLDTQTDTIAAAAAAIGVPLNL